MNTRCWRRTAPVEDMRTTIKRTLHREMNKEFADLPTVITERDIYTHEIKKVAIILPYSEELEKKVEDLLTTPTAETVANDFTSTSGSSATFFENEVENQTINSEGLSQNPEPTISRDTEDIEKIAKHGWSPNLLQKFFKKS